MSKLNIMLDLETLSTRPNAHILSLGAAVFTPDGVRDAFYAVANNREQVGTHIDPATARWWITQSQAAWEEVTRGTGTLHDALRGFQLFANAQRFDNGDKVTADDILVWGNGANFDNVILADAYRREAMPVPWGTYNNRCYRTLKKLMPDVPMPKVSGVHHNALDDAKNQAQHAVALLNKIGGWE